MSERHGTSPEDGESKPEDQAQTTDDCTNAGAGNSDFEADDGEFGEDFDELPSEIREAVPVWEDEYLDRVSDRLMHTYDLEKEVRERGESFDLYGELRVESSKHLFHPSVQYANHHMREFLYGDRRSSVTVADLERLVEFGHELADERVDPSDEHRATEFTFVLVTPEIPTDVRSFVDGFSNRTLLKYGYHGHYEVHLCVVAPAEEDIVASDRTEISGAFSLWGPVEKKRGLVSRVRSALFL
ncbi:hypothetical protein [Halostagnicola bangensis]